MHINANYNMMLYIIETPDMKVQRLTDLVLLYIIILLLHYFIPFRFYPLFLHRLFTDIFLTYVSQCNEQLQD